jgi:hypothetical protein
MVLRVFLFNFELQFCPDGQASALIFHFEFLIFSSPILLLLSLSGLGPTFFTSSINSVITWANLCPSAAENHSSLNRSFSKPNSSKSFLVISNCSAAR